MHYTNYTHREYLVSEVEVEVVVEVEIGVKPISHQLLATLAFLCLGC